MRVLIFVCLKVVEISGVVFLPYYLGKLQFLHWLNPDEWEIATNCAALWGAGLLTAVFWASCLAVLALLATAARWFVMVNWEWAKDIKYSLKIRKDSDNAK